VFTGGIGENSAPVRERTLNHLQVFGFAVDAARNAKSGRESNGRITSDHSRVALVVPTNEELLIARDTAALIPAAAAA